MKHPKNNRQKKQKKKKKKKSSNLHARNEDSRTTAEPQTLMYNTPNFMADAGPGCYIARRGPHQPQPRASTPAVFSSSAAAAVSVENHNTNSHNSPTNTNTDWMIGWEDVDPDDFDGVEGADVPDIALDPDEYTLSICNVQSYTKIAYVTVYATPLRDKNGRLLIPGQTSATTSNTANTRKTTPKTMGPPLSTNTTTTKMVSCITFIVMCPPRVFAHLCYVERSTTLATMRIESDVSQWQPHPQPHDEHPYRVSFPLHCCAPPDIDTTQSSRNTATNNNTTNTNANANNEKMITTMIPTMATTTAAPQYLCTQGEGGALTHFFAGNYHAIDLRCPVGTAIVAVADGTVRAVQEAMATTPNTPPSQHTVTGIAATNLFHWNSILLQLRLPSQQQQQQQTSDKTTDPTADDGPLYVEYVHISKAFVRVGERVTRGQIIGASGSIGFSPEPHLHFSAYRSAESKAPTVRVRFQNPTVPLHTTRDREQDREDTTTTITTTQTHPSPFLPRAGLWYDCNGVVT